MLVRYGVLRIRLWVVIVLVVINVHNHQSVHCLVSVSIPRNTGFLTNNQSCLRIQNSNVVEAEFVRSENDNDNDDVMKKDTTINVNKDEQGYKSKTLLELSLDSDSDWKEMRVPFIDPYSISSDSADGNDVSSSYIDIKLGFVAELDGTKYGIGIPFDSPVAIAVENLETGTVQYLSPDNDDNKEIMEIMAAQLQQNFGDDLSLQRTTRVLTVRGPLEEKYLKDWKEKILPKPISPEDLLKDDDEDINFFREFMLKELGEEEYKKTIAQTDSDDNIDDRVFKLFDSTLSTDDDSDDESLQSLLKAIMDDPNDDTSFQVELDRLLKDEAQPTLSDAAIKLVSYILPPSKSENQKGVAYSLVKLSKPIAFIGRYVPISLDNGDMDVRFELLSYDSEKVVVPMLEELFWRELSDAGLTLR